jgi:hypothetical protein
MKKGSKKAREAGRKAALTRKRNMGKGGASKSRKHGFGAGRCPNCGFKVGKIKRTVKMSKERRKELKNKMLRARKAAIAAGWSGVPGTKMNKAQKAAFREAGWGKK